ncbi:hypothetical protein PR048_009547 [Dryococelus australis]|uniref:Uncharacterized protein n=1 Tax=Dryococelus australis TaxID=614101 RepID=A0ABQ9I063_9NEOP|nr:hypothetical protein PR048_009547 [Dryococelus australis]
MDSRVSEIHDEDEYCGRDGEEDECGSEHGDTSESFGDDDVEPAYIQEEKGSSKREEIRPRPPKKVACLYLMKEGTSSTQVKEKLIQTIDPKEDGLRIRNLREI